MNITYALYVENKTLPLALFAVQTVNRNKQNVTTGTSKQKAIPINVAMSAERKLAYVLPVEA